LVPFPSNLPPALRVKTPTGTAQPGKFASEFGCVGMSSFESMSVTLAPTDWSLHSSPMAQRNYPCDNIIDVYWGKQDLSQSGERAFKKQLYQCLIGQALEMKSDIEVRRSTNEFGTVIWQLNEIWPTGGWGSVEYGTPVPGQVIGGRWKPLQYWLSAFLYKDIIATCSNGAQPQCLVKNDNPLSSFSGNFVLSVLRFSDGKQTVVTREAVNLGKGAGETAWFCAITVGGKCGQWEDVLSAGGCSNANECLVLTEIGMQRNFVLLAPLSGLKLPSPQISYSVEKNNGTVSVTSSEVALFVTLTAQAQGRFEFNTFWMGKGETVKVPFIWYGESNVPLLESTLRLEHVAMYL